jgi:hypothetical protein
MVSFLICLAAGCGAVSPPPDDDGRCPTARGNDLLASERRQYEMIGAGLPAPPSVEVFNRAAEELEVPFRWTGDTNGDGRLDPGEVLFGRDADGDGRVTAAEITLRGEVAGDPWVMTLPTDVNHGALSPYFTDAFAASYLRIVTHARGQTGAGAPEGQDASREPKTF